jgi:hypothetical protein
MMPTLQDYDLAVDNLAISALDPELAEGSPERDGNGLVAYTGGVSRVYPVRVGDRTGALRCWHKQLDRQSIRYRHLMQLFNEVQLPYFTKVRYIESGLRIRSDAFPVVWMEWIHAPPLNLFLDANANNRAALGQVSELFVELVADLHRHRIAHGDLQDGNILVMGQENAFALRLVDYDTMYVPTLGTWANDATVVRDFQHPHRSRVPHLSLTDDYFSELVIFLSLRAIAEDESLWKVGSERRLLFSESDFADPDASEMFARLWRMSPEVRRLAVRLRNFCHSEPDCLAPLEEVWDDARTLAVERYFKVVRDGDVPEAAGGVQDAEQPDECADGGVGKLEEYFSTRRTVHVRTAPPEAARGRAGVVVLVLLLSVLLAFAVWASSQR